MLVSELLDELRGSILRDVSSLTAGAADTLWTDTQLLRYINQAQVRFARLTHILRDSATTAVTQITLVAGQTEYPLHASVLAVLSARYHTDVVDLPRSSHITLDTRVPADTPWYDVNAMGAVSPGRPRAYTTDQSFRTLRVYPAPTAAEAGTLLRLRVSRLPLTVINSAALATTPEIPEEYQMEMLEWAAHLALSNHDADAGNMIAEGQPLPSDVHKANFEAHVTVAKADVRRQMFATMRIDLVSTPGVTYTR